jgi:hypothetical protein
MTKGGHKGRPYGPIGTRLSPLPQSLKRKE